jgi:hypothetical protein
LSPTPGLGTPESRAPRSALAAALLGRPGPEGVGVVVLQLVLVLLWHVVLVVGPPLLKEGIASLLLPPDLAGLLAAIVVGAIGSEAILAYFPYRIVTRRQRFSLAHFTRVWWRTCFWGLVAFPIFGLLVWYESDILVLWVVLLVIHLLAGPAWLAYRQRGPLVRRSRWQPVCPECGYSLRRLTSDRCPECGEAFPTPSRVYRHWANRRLPWERRARGSLLFAYVRTVLLIIFRPTRAARGLVIPDRYGKAVRWAVVHLVVVALLGTVCLSQTYFRDSVLVRFLPSAGLFTMVNPSVGEFAVWTAQSVGIWLAALSSFPLVGVGLGIAVPGRHPAARRSIVKWSLYNVGGIGLGLGLTILFASLAYSLRTMSLVGAMRPGPRWWTHLLEQAPRPVWLVLWAALYGCWWAMGVAGNPFLRRRGWAVFLAHALGYITVWLIVAKVLFDPGDLQELL